MVSPERAREGRDREREGLNISIWGGLQGGGGGDRKNTSGWLPGFWNEHLGSHGCHLLRRRRPEVGRGFKREERSTKDSFLKYVCEVCAVCTEKHPQAGEHTGSEPREKGFQGPATHLPSASDLTK